MTDRGGTPLHNLDWPGCALFGLYRASRVALVTPLRDGMSLVGKEFIAAQDPADPGVLSRFAGATAPLDSALLVNPCDIESTVQAIQQALQMTLDKRCNRHAVLLERIKAQDVHWWRTAFLAALKNSVPVD